jgi:hypothetical protein
MIPGVFVYRFDWNDIGIEVSYEPDWLRSVGVAHLQVRSVAPARTPLPVSETGYRSHFAATADVLEQGGPIAYARAMLDDAANEPAWHQTLEESRQRTLF